jgi:integrase
MPSLIFTGRYGALIDPRTLSRKFTARCDAAGVRQLTVRDARHICATLLVDLDVHPRVIMRILRHADQAGERIKRRLETPRKRSSHMARLFPLLLLPTITTCRGRLSAAGLLAAGSLPIASGPG